MNTAAEDEEAAMTMKISKQFPLNMQLADEHLIMSNPRIVDIEWATCYSLASKNLNKLLQPRFKITLTVLCLVISNKEVFLKQWKEARNELRIKAPALNATIKN